jgi:CubicO group peptidase (beta-lactamase class C family)
MTVHDLLRHTSGLTYGVFLPKTQLRKSMTKRSSRSRT